MVLAKSRHTKEEKTFTDAEWAMLERDGHARNFQLLRRFVPTAPPELRQPKATAREQQKEKAPEDKPEGADLSI